MTTSQNFLSIPRDGRNVGELEERLRRFIPAGSVTDGGAAGVGRGLVTVRVPTDPEQRGQVLRVVSEWRDAPA